MKLRNLFMAVVAGAAMLVGCNKEVDLGPAKLALDQTTLAFEAAGGSQTVSVTATRDWAVSGVPDWVALSATNGKAAVEAQPVKITVAQNAEYNRSATIVFTIGFARTSLTINQAGPEGEIDNGDGTLENPFNVAGVIEYVNELGADVASPKKVFVEGIISAVDEEFNTQYGNGAFKISDDGSTSGAQFTAYRVLYLGNKKFAAGDTQIKVGDVVIIYGNVVNYKGNTPETQQNSAFLYSLNGVDKGGAEGGGGQAAEPKGTGTEVDPFNVAAAIAKALETGETATENSYYIKGKVGSVTDQFNSQYGNATFTMIDAGFDATFTAYRVLYFNNKKWALGGKEIKEGDEVVVCAKIVNFKGNTPETSGGYVVSINGEGGSDTPGEEEDYTKAEAKTVAEFIQLGDKNTYYKLTGSVSGFNPTYCSFDLTDATGSIYVYSVLDAFKTDEWKNKIKNGGTITIAGKYDYYASKNQHEVVSAAFLAYEEGETPGGSDEQKGSGTLADPYNAAKANAVASALESGAKSDDVYVKGKISSIKYTFSAQYGTATFNISDDGSTTGSQFTCYSVYYLGNRPWADGDMQVAVGDEVIIHGKLVNYNGNTPETSSKEAYVYSLNGQTEIAPSDSFGVTATEISVGASETVATIGITGNVKWTASSADATLDVTSGEGAKEIKASFAANTDTENAKVYTVKVSTTADVPTMEYIVTITQGKASSGNAVTVSVDFTPVIDALPQGSGNGVKDGTYTLGGYSFTMHANDKFYQAKTGDLYYLLIGKKDSYIELPTVDGKALVSVKFLTGSAASENVIIDIAKADGTLLGINTEKNKKGTEYTYTVNGEVNAVYRIAVTNAYNAQFQNLELTYE